MSNLRKNMVRIRIDVPLAFCLHDFFPQCVNRKRVKKYPEYGKKLLTRRIESDIIHHTEQMFD